MLAIWILIALLPYLVAEKQDGKFPDYPNDGWKHPVFRKTYNILEGENVTLYCRNATPGPFYGIYWTNMDRWQRSVYSYGYRTDTGILIDPFLRGRVSLDGASLRIINVKEGDSGFYDCSIVYFYYKTGIPRATTWAQDTLNVLVPPKAVVEPRYATPRVHETVILDCRILKGTAPVVANWTRVDGKPLEKGKFELLNNGTRLVLLDINLQDSGDYQCSVFNKYGIDSAFGNVKMKVPPVITRSPSYININVHKTGKIVCRAIAFPLPSFRWKIRSTNGSVREIHPGERVTSRLHVTSINSVGMDTAQSVLVLSKLEKEDWNYLYTCISWNSEGMASRNFTVQGNDYPARPSIRQIKISSSAATIYWSISNDGGAPLTSVTMWYRNITQVGWTKVFLKPVLSTKHIIRGLRPNTNYEFKLLASNEVGDSTESGVYGARTRSSDSVGAPAAPPSHLNVTAVIGILAGTFVAVIVAIVIVFMLVRKLQKPVPPVNRDISITNGRPISLDNGSAQGLDQRLSQVTSLEMEPLVPKIDRWEFPRNRLRLSSVLGSGAFGLVRRAEAEGIDGSVGRVKVAVKMLKDSGSRGAKRDLLAELEVLKFIPSHPNIVCLLGCCTRGDPIMVIVEYCANGDLQGFLRNSRGISERYYRASYGGAVPNLTSKMLLKFASQIARGMAHLASLKVIHRDLAARNVLVDEHLNCKVADFGFARDIYVEEHYMRKSQNGRFPVKWMAIESLVDTISTTKSDVWSFGVVLWEIITLGASPYPGMNAYEVVTFLQDGYRMDKPKHCSNELYSIMIDCWHVSAMRRPEFSDLAEIMRLMAECDKDAINMNFYQDHLYVNFDLPINDTSTSLPGSESERTTLQAAAIG